MEAVVYADLMSAYGKKRTWIAPLMTSAVLGESRHPPATVARMSTRPKTPTGVLALCFLQMEYEP